ncbi:MAG: glycosyltransferase family 4 protein [Dehalococcoidia bacterium]|nr:glycosyltransferase family 4 protein [Dehalococcoidia bacterium]
MRILHVIRQFYPCVGGIEKYALDLCRHLIARGHVCDVVTLNRNFADKSLLPPRDSYEGIDIFRVPYAGPNRYKLAPGVLRFTGNYDLIHVHAIDFFVDYLALTRFFHRKPVVVSTHGGFFHSKWAVVLKWAFFYTITMMTMRAAARIICDSYSDYALFRPIAQRKAIVIENGVDYGSFSTVAKRIQRGLLLSIGRTDANKRPDNLIRALAGVARDVPEAQLVFIGPDWLGIWPELKALAIQLSLQDRVVFAGFCQEEEMLDYLARAHFFVSASQYEGFGIAAVEAMSTGTVPVLNDIDSFRTFVNHGVNGFIADFSRPELAAATLRQALSLDDAALLDMGEKARQKAANYAWPNVVGKIEKVYEEALGRGASIPSSVLPGRMGG